MTRNFFTVLTVLLAVRAVASVAVVTPVSVNAGGNVTTKDLVIYSPPRNVTQLGLSTTSSDAVDIGPVGGVIWGAIITGSFSYSGSVCGAAITVGGPAGIAACAVAIAGTVITSAFAAYYYGNAKRSEDIDWDVNPTYAPTLGCSTGCQLEAQTSHGTWTHFANKTTNGRFHSLYFYQNNTIKGLKAVQHNTQPPALNTREDPLITEAVDEGSSTYGDQNWIGTYYWEDGSESA
jgi:hypothetical protein